jgi:hypothetical protein
VIDELALERAFDELGQDIAVPDEGAGRVVELLSVARPSRKPATRTARALMVAAALLVAVGVGVAVQATARDQSSFVQAGGPAASENANRRDLSLDKAHERASARSRSARPPSTTIPSSGPVVPVDGPVDGAKIVKTGSLDLRVPEDALKPTVNRVTGVAVGLGGYVGSSKTDLRSDVATAQVTIRVPVANFETAVNRLEGLPGVDVLSSSASGSDVTGEYTDLQARLNAATTERNSLLAVLSEASTVGDILAVRDRVAAVNSQIEQLQGEINLLDDQASLSAIAVSLTEKRAKEAATAAAGPPTGMSKAWKDARDGFFDSIEWIVARSGGALIVLLAALALIFGIRYLYPVLRRALL